MSIDNTLFSRSIRTWGEDKQQVIAESCILVAGVGGLGSIVSEILMRSGIGKIIIIDDGIIDEPDLNRQTLYTFEDIGKNKVDVAYKRLSAIHDQSEVIPINLKIEPETIFADIIKQYHFQGIADCLDNYESRFVLEQLLQTGDLFLVHGGVQNDFGQITTIIKDKTRLLKDLYKEVDKTEPSLPVCPQIVSCVGSIIAHEVLYNLWNVPRLLNTLLVVEFSDFSFFKIRLDQKS